MIRTPRDEGGRFRRVVVRAALCMTLSWIVTSAAAAPPVTAPLKGQMHAHPELGPHRLLVKFRAEAAPLVDTDGRLTLGAVPLAKAAAGLRHGMRFRRALEVPVPGMLARRGGAFDGRVLAEFSGLMYVEAPGADNDSLLRLARALEALDVVEYATLEALRGPPPPGAVDIAPPTGLYTDRQDWLGSSAASNGMDCRYAWTRGAKGRGVRVFDIEDSWGDLNHEDFDSDSLAYGRPRFSDDYADHGIAVFGAIFGQHNAYGIDGCAPEATGRAYSFQNQSGQQSRAATLVLMGEAARPGDVILLEMQGGGLGEDNLAPADVDVAVWNATKAATDKGVIVLGTAGNGSANLDGTAYAAYRARGDNGVIMVGGGNSSTRARSVGSYGACCVHVQGWGQNVATSGYSDLFKPNNDIRQSYTARFSGTSSAGAVMAGAVTALQSHALAVLGRPLTPLEMRELLIATGRPHTGSFHIGPLPDLRAAILRLDSLAAQSTPPAPAGLVYAPDSVVLRVDSALTDWIPTYTGNVTAWSIAPPLPAGLIFDTATGAIRGTPLQAAAPAPYTVTATNVTASAQTVLQLAVLAPVSVRADARVFRAGGAGGASVFRLEADEAVVVERATVSVSDLRGRLLWTRTVHPSRTPGLVEVVWNGRTTAGTAVPAGQYILRVTEVRDGNPITRVRRGVWIASP